MTQIGIIGNGNVGSALERGFSGNGHETRSVGKQPDEVRDVAAWADVVVLAVPYPERENAFKEMGDAVKGKVVLDVTNAVGEDGFQGSMNQSGAEQLQERHRDVRIVKAFNTVFAQHMDEGKAAGETLSLFVAADDDEAREQVMRLGQEIGFDPIDAGPLETARCLEALGYLNITLGYQLKKGTETGFRYVHPSSGGSSQRRMEADAEAAE